MSDLYALLQQGRDEGIYPSARAVVVFAGDVLFDGGVGEAGPSAVFDLASLTKVMATTAVFASLWAEGRVGPEQRLGEFLPDAAAADVTLEDLLTHRSGLPSGRPCWIDSFAALSNSPTPEVRAREAAATLQRFLRVAPEVPPCTRALYSDAGFILLGRALEIAGGAPLDALYEARVATPLGLNAQFRRPSVAQKGPLPLATGDQRPRPPEPTQAPLTVTPVPTVRGEVDDDNAWALDGVAGHAGLFGTALDVAGFGQAILEESLGAARLAPEELWARLLTRDTKTPESTRTFGFDTPSATGSSAGDRFGPHAVGHLGFTGTSVWIDLDRRLVVALLTNRTALGRDATRQAIRTFRPRFHDAVLDALGVPPRDSTSHG